MLTLCLVVCLSYSESVCLCIQIYLRQPLFSFLFLLLCACMCVPACACKCVCVCVYAHATVLLRSQRFGGNLFSSYQVSSGSQLRFPGLTPEPLPLSHPAGSCLSLFWKSARLCVSSWLPGCRCENRLRYTLLLPRAKPEQVASCPRPCQATSLLSRLRSNTSLRQQLQKWSLVLGRGGLGKG